MSTMKIYTLVCTSLFLAVCVQLHAQSKMKLPDSEIYVLNMKYDNGSYTFSDATNISNNPGFDNQPAFSADGSYLLYTSSRDGKQTDIYKYDLATKKSSCLSKTNESEFAPSFMPDGKNFSVVRVEKNDRQRVWKCALGGGEYSIVTNRLDSIAYHLWWYDNNLLLNYIKKPPFLGMVNMHNGRERFLSDVAGRCMQTVPGENSMTFYAAGPHKDSAGTIRKISEYFEIGIIAPALAGSEDFAWTNHRTLLMARGSKLYEYDFSEHATWREIADFSQYGIGNFYRISLDTANNRIAVVTYSGKERP